MHLLVGEIAFEEGRVENVVTIDKVTVCVVIPVVVVAVKFTAER